MKRALDIVASVFALVLFSPILLVVAILVRLYLGNPILFSQERPGKNGHIFRMFKFRTMTDEKGTDGQLLSDEERLTRLGKFLRASSLDELPGLLNVVKGDMSLVGPRPLLVRYLDRYNQFQARRHEVRPGLTGWAQVNGRNAISWEQKFELDVWYVDNRNMLLDIKILILTVKKVFVRDGISANDHVTMPEFMGTKDEK